MPPPRPDRPVQIVGDIHGRADLLTRLMLRLDPSQPIVFVGDYIDRGDESIGVLEQLLALSNEQEGRVTCLLGNHEEMLLRVIDDRRGALEQWLRHGGLQTIASLGIAPPSEETEAAKSAFRDRLEQRLGPQLISWLRSLPIYYQSGTLGVVHAAADPELPLSMQSREVLLWGHPDFLRKPRADGLWIAHGHTIHERPTTESGRIAIDTGAYATGNLTATRVTEDGTICFIRGS